MKTRFPGNFILYIIISLLVACGGGGGGTECLSVDCADNYNSLQHFGVGGFNTRVSSIAPALDGSDDVYVGGSFTKYENFVANHIARFNNDGSFDTGFVSGTGFDHPVFAISPASDSSGDVYAGGSFSSYNGTPVGSIARVNLDGSLDTGFATGVGFEDTSFGFAAVGQITPAIDGSGDIYVAGRFTGYNGIAINSWLVRLNNDGSLDTGFNAGADGWGERGFTLANDGSGDIYVTRKSSPGIARLNNDGSIDAGFDTGPSGFNAQVRSIGVANDGSGDVYVVGDFDDYNGTVTIGIARLNSDGSLDAGFVTGSGFLGTVKQVIPAIDGSGDIYVGGNPQVYQDNFIGRFVRLNDDGTIDMNFIHKFFPFPGFNDETRSIALAIDGSGDVYVGGGFTSYGVVLSVDHLVSFTVDGSLKLGRLD
jgi:uncharacterized delta-60 repeat protein